MIINTVRLFPFGGTADRSYAFAEGLNVLLGPNEAGKSTLVNALFAALFVPPDVRRSADDWKNFLARCLPYPEGDTARVEIEFTESGGRRLRYRCAWGGAREERLYLEDGTEINEPAAIRERLSRALRFGRGTYQGVLFARQDEMARTVARLRENPEACRTIAGLLRAALFEAGGVSVEALEAAIDAAEEKLLQNWDLERDEPAGSRGLENPYKRGVGEILAAYYRMEELRKRCREARAAEEQAAELAGRLEASAAAQEALRQRLGEMERFEDDARERAALEPRLESLALQEKHLKKIISDWPRAEERLQGIKKQIENAEKEAAALETELWEAEAVIKGRAQRELLHRAQPLQAAVAEKEAALAAMPRLARTGLEQLEQKEQELERLKAVVEAMKLRAHFSTAAPLELTVTASLDEPQAVRVERELALEGAGRLLLEAPDWTLEVFSGEGDAAQIIEQIHREREALEVKLRELAVKDLAEARAACARREAAAGDLGTLRARLETLLGELSYGELEAAVASLGPEKAVREPEAIRSALEEVKVSLSTLQVEAKREAEQIARWEEQFGSFDQTVDELAELRRQIREAEARLAKLAPLPEGYDSGDAFFNALKEMREERYRLNERVAALKEELALLQSRLPEESTEELAEALGRAEAEWERLKSRGRAIRVVKSEFKALKDELDGGTLEPLAELFAQNLAILTGRRYTAARLDGAVPGEIISAEGKALPVELLSAGTTAGVALALRLAMCAYLLQGAGGFMIMDDPLVNFDPERKKAAAGVIQKFARTSQLIVTTCDPETARLLGGNLIQA